MGFQEQVAKVGVSGGSGFSMFREGVNVKWMGGKTLGSNGIVNFRILPAHNPADKMADGSVNPHGWLPSRAPDGRMTDWGFMIESCRFVGHKAYQMDFLSPVGIDDERPFLLDNVYNVCVANPDWNYLVAREKTGRTPPVLSRPMQTLMMNALLVDGGLQEVVLAGFTRRSIDALLAPGSGLLNQSVELPPEMVQQNYMMQWRVRDITNPTDGYVIQLKKNADNTFTADLQQVNGTTRKLPIDSSLLPARYPLYDWKSLCNLKSQDQVVSDLLRVFGQRNAAGVHEHYMLKEALEPLGYNIPNPASAPAAGASVQSGFEKPAAAAAAAPTPAAYTAPTAAAPTPAAYTAPTAAPGVYVPPTAPAQQAQPAQDQQAQPAQPAPAQPAQDQQAQPAQPAPAQQAQPAQDQQAQPAQGQQAQPAQPVVPGDNVAPTGADQAWMADFLQDLKG